MNILKKPWMIGLLVSFTYFWIYGYFFGFEGIDNWGALLIFVLPFFLASGVALGVIFDSIIKRFKSQKVNWMLFGFMVGIVSGIFGMPRLFQLLLGVIPFPQAVFSILILALLGAMLGFLAEKWLKLKSH